MSSRTTRGHRAGVVALLAIAAGLASAAVLLPGVAAQAVPLPGRACSGSALAAGVQDAGHDNEDAFRWIVVTNRSAAACSVHGWPSMRLVARGRGVGDPAGRFAYSAPGGVPATPTIRLQPGRSAALWVALTTLPPSGCRAVAIDALQLRLGGGAPVTARLTGRDRGLVTRCSGQRESAAVVSQFVHWPRPR